MSQTQSFGGPAQSFGGPTQFAPQQHPGGFGPGPIPPGMPGPGVQPPPVKEKGAAGKIIAIVVSVLVVLIGLGTGVYLLFFSTGIVEKAKVQDSITQQFAAQQLPVTVNCPTDLKAKVGEQVTCSVAGPENMSFSAHAVVQSVDGKQANYKVDFTTMKPTVEKAVTAMFAENGYEVKSTCDADLPTQLNASTTCTVATPDDPSNSTRIKVTVDNVDKMPKPHYTFTQES